MEDKQVPSSSTPAPVSTPPTETGDPEVDRQARLEYWKSTNPPPTPKPKHTRRWVVIGLLVLLMLAAAGFAYWKFYMQPPAVVPIANKKTNQQQTVNPPKHSTATKHFASPSLGLQFDYPIDWTAAEPTNAPLTITSPAMTMKDSANKNLTGQVVIAMRAKQASLSVFSAGSAVAIRASEKIKYTKPTSVQRAETYISFLRYAGSTGTGLDGIYITGDHGYQKDQNIPASDVLAANPLVTVAFALCSEATCANTDTALNIAPSMWDNADFSDQIKTVLTSLSVN